MKIVTLRIIHKNIKLKVPMKSIYIYNKIFMLRIIHKNIKLKVPVNQKLIPPTAQEPINTTSFRKTI